LDKKGFLSFNHNTGGYIMNTLNNKAIAEQIVDPTTYGSETRYHEIFTTLRKTDPVHWCEPEGYKPFWAVTKHADILRVEGDAEHFLNAPRQFLVSLEEERMMKERTGKDMFARNLVAMDNPDHRAYRNLTASWFSPKTLKSLDEEIQKLATRTVDHLISLDGECEFVNEVAAWFPLRTIMLILGVPEKDEPLMLSLSQKIFGNTDIDTGGGDGLATMLDAFDEFRKYFSVLTEDRRKNPKNDVVSLLANATINDKPIGEDELYAYYLIAAAAGHDTTSSAISGGLLALIQYPDEMEKLRQDPSLLPLAINEFIRWTSPVKHFFRTATCDIEVGGKQIKEGDSLMMCYPSANRDSDVFDEPFQFKVDRKPNQQIAFGFGPHVCLGQHLARMEIQALFSKILERITAIKLNGDPAWVNANFVSGLKHLPIKYSF